MDSPQRRSVRRALDALKPYLEAFLAQHRVSVPPTGSGPGASRPDMQALLKASIANWEPRLQAVLPRVARSYLHELKEVRNRWAHEEQFTDLEARRGVDTARVLAELLGAPTSSTTPETRRETPRGASSGPRPESQRAAMVRIFHSVGRNADRAVREYAAAEGRGEVLRRSNKSQISSEAYARALLNDGLKKGWLR